MNEIVFVGGVFCIVRTNIFKENILVGIIVIVFVFLCVLKIGLELFRACFSKRASLLNYLFSPYFFAWRRDHLKQFSDLEIIKGICQSCEINGIDFSHDKLNLKDLLIRLFMKEFKGKDKGIYKKELENNINLANKIEKIN